MAVMLGVVWTLNRYYVGRVDTLRLRVDSDVKAIREPGSDYALLVFRLDVVNTSTILIGQFEHYLEIESATPSAEGTIYKSLYRWPESGTHPGGMIEPGSWSAINEALSIPATTGAVRIFLGIELPGHSWTWHKTFDISKREKDG
jgi:hypothetical protein